MLATLQQGSNNIGDAVRQGIDGIVSQALATAQREIEQKLGEMRAQRAGLEDALRSTTSRPGRLEIQTRIDRVDREIAELERAMSRMGRNVEVRQDRGATFSGTGPQLPAFPPARIDPVPIIGTTLGILFVAFPLALTISRYIWKRSTHAPAPALSQEQTRRFDRLEQSVDAIAIEVERISENQRYLTKLLAEPKRAEKIGS